MIKTALYGRQTCLVRNNRPRDYVSISLQHRLLVKEDNNTKNNNDKDNNNNNKARICLEEKLIINEKKELNTNIFSILRCRKDNNLP